MKKILVYDSQHAYIRFFKINLRGEYIVKSFNELEEEDYNDYSAIVFLLYEESEFFDFVKLYSQDLPIVFGTDNWRVLAKIDTFKMSNKEIIALDLRNGKHKILRDLRDFLTN